MSLSEAPVLYGLLFSVSVVVGVLVFKAIL